MGGAGLASILKIPALAVGLTLADAEATLPEVDQSFGMSLSVADGHGALHAVPIRLEGATQDGRDVFIADGGVTDFVPSIDALTITVKPMSDAGLRKRATRKYCT